VNEMEIYLYTVCYNEEILLPHFLAHYGSLCTKMFFFDNCSTDGSARLIDSHPKASRTRFETRNELRDRWHTSMKSSEYKKARGAADWVIIVDVDEFIYHPDLPQLLSQYKANGVTFPKTQGYDMVSQAPPARHCNLLQEIRTGVSNNLFSKRAVFSPTLDVEYQPGCHLCTVQGDVKESEGVDIKLLHYRFLGKDYFLQRSTRKRVRLSLDNMKHGWGVENLQEDDHLAKLFDDANAQAQIII